MALPWLRLLGANLLTWRPQESPCGFVVDKLSLEQGLFRYFGYPVPLSYQQCSILTHLSISKTWQLRSLNNIIQKLITYQLVWRFVAWPSLTSTVCLTLLDLLHKKITSVHFFWNISGTIQLPINRFSWNLIFVYFLKNRHGKWSFTKTWQE